MGLGLNYSRGRDWVRVELLSGERRGWEIGLI
jgi:hypothetical protein